MSANLKFFAIILALCLSAFASAGAQQQQQLFGNQEGLMGQDSQPIGARQWMAGGLEQTMVPEERLQAEPRQLGGARLVRRQVVYQQPAPLSPFNGGAEQQPAAPPQNGVFKFLSELGPQVDAAKSFSSLFSSSSSSPTSGGAGGPSQLPFNPAQMMGQLSELIRSTQERNAKALESTERTVAQTGQQTASAAKQAQGGIQAALAEMGQGLQRLAVNNPSLLPDIKNLYQSVSSKLSSASSSVAQAVAPPKSGPEQFADQLVKAAGGQA